MAHPALGDDMVGERLHVGAASFQHRHLQAAIVVDVHMKRRLREAVVVVKILGQPLRQFARRMVVDITQGRDAVAAALDLRAQCSETAAQEIADRLGTIGIAMLCNEFIDFGDEVVVNGGCQALHSHSPSASRPV